jgi:hypothetical protein
MTVNAITSNSSTISKGTWTVGPCSGTVVTDDAEGFVDATGHCAVDYYGGYLIAESIMLRKKTPGLISAAKDMLHVLTVIYEANQDVPQLPPMVLAEVERALNKANGIKLLPHANEPTAAPAIAGHDEH